MMYLYWIIISVTESGDIFEGTVEQFADCFFSNVTEEGIIQFAKCDLGATEITFRYGEEPPSIPFLEAACDS